MRVPFKTTLEEDLINSLKIKAIKKKVDVNDILEILIKKFLEDEDDQTKFRERK